MCKTKMAVDAYSPRNPRTPKSRTPSASRPAADASFDPSSSYANSAANSASSGFRLTSDTSISSGASLASFRDSLLKTPTSTTSLKFAPPPTISSPSVIPPPLLLSLGDVLSEAETSLFSSASSVANSR
ncbi:hypothetical protein K1719_042952 [Acacia pycnantha]|nr:hypothetical protein K1719_042952 [Acacia pycnantha]